MTPTFVLRIQITLASAFWCDNWHTFPVHSARCFLLLSTLQLWWGTAWILKPSASSESTRWVCWGLKKCSMSSALCSNFRSQVLMIFMVQVALQAAFHWRCNVVIYILYIYLYLLKCFYFLWSLFRCFCNLFIKFDLSYGYYIAKLLNYAIHKKAIRTWEKK